MNLSTESVIKLGRILEAIHGQGIQARFTAAPRELGEKDSDGHFRIWKWFEIEIKFDMHQESE